MKRVFLQHIGLPIAYQTGRQPEVLRVSVDILRLAAVALGRFAVNGRAGRDVGDPIHDWVTENRRRENERRRLRGSPEVSYSSCGDLGNWLLMCLGCRDERLINRDWDGGVVPWKIGANVSTLARAPGYVHWIPGVHFPSSLKPGDILHVCNEPGSDHISVLEVVDVQGGKQHSFEYGQPYARERERKIEIIGSELFIDGRKLRGWIDLERLPLVTSAVVPSDFTGGITDDNPYEEDGLYLPSEG